MRQNNQKSTHNSLNKSHHKIFLACLILCIAVLPLCPAATFDNTKSFDSEIGDYGKVIIKDWFGLQKLTDLELKENTDVCGIDCSATKEIIMYQSGTLIDDVNFEIINSDGSRESGGIEGYNFYIIDGEKRQEYILGENVKAGTYNVKLEGKKEAFKDVDWIIKSQGFWIEEWAVWSSGLNDGLIAYYPMANETGQTGFEPDLANRTTISNFTTNECLIGGCANTTASAGFVLNNSDGYFNTSKTNGNFTYAGWVKPVTNGANDYLLKDDTYVDWAFIAGGNANEEYIASEHLTTTSIGTLNAWNFMVLMRNSTTSCLYKDNVKQECADNSTTRFTNNQIYFGSNDGNADANTFDGLMDEWGVWNRSLTISEMTDLYNGGAGLTYDALRTDPEVSVVLNSPADTTTFVRGTTQIFNSTATPLNSNLTNATFYAWDSSHTLLNKTFKLINGNLDTVNSTTFNPSFSSVGTENNWNVEWCAWNGTNTGTICAFQGTNRSFDVDAFTVNSRTFNNNTIQGSFETFILNITLGSGARVTTSFLNYNNTNYASSVNEGSVNTIIINNLTIPAVTKTVNNSLFWILNFEDGGQSNTSALNQSVGILGMDDCTTFTNRLFNFTILDEDNQSKLTGGPENVSIKLEFQINSLLDGSSIFNYSNGSTLTNPYMVCLENNLSTATFSLDGVVEYNSRGRFQEYYHFQNYELNNATPNLLINLYNLNSTLGQEFKITFKDSNFVPISGAIMDIQRKYIAEGVFKTIEKPKTNAEGYTIGHLIRNDAIYNIIVSKDGAILGSFLDVVADCQNPALFSCEVNLNSFTSSNLPSDFTNFNDISMVFTFNKTNREIKSIYTIPSGASAVVALNVTLFDSLGNTTVCTDSLNSAGGQLSCTVPLSFGNSSVVARIYKDNLYIGQMIVKLWENPLDIYGQNLLFLSLFMALIFIGIASMTDNPMVYGIILILGSIMMVAMNLIYSPSFIGAGATLLWFIITIVLVMIKGGSRQ